jgi:hypothetical protein
MSKYCNRSLYYIYYLNILHFSSSWSNHVNIITKFIAKGVLVHKSRIWIWFFLYYLIYIDT